MQLTEHDQCQMFDAAWAVIWRGSHDGVRSEADDFDFSATLLQPGASFLTLSQAGQLRGCCGSLKPTRSLGADIVANAWATAFNDPRFPPVRSSEVGELDLDISVLSALSPLPATSREELIHQLRPGQDGLLVQVGGRRATFLPKVWDSLPDPEDFLDQLWRKAGWSTGQWPGTLLCWRYSTCVYRRAAPWSGSDSQDSGLSSD